MPYIYKRPGWQNYYIGLTAREKEILGRGNFSTGTTNERAAIKLKEETRKEIKHLKDQPVTPRINKNLTLAEAFDIMQTDRANTEGVYSQNTIDGYNESIKKVTAACGNKYIYQFTREDYHLFIGSLETSQNTKATHSRRIYALFNFLVREKYLTENSFKRVKEKQKEVIIKTKEEIETLLNYSRSTKFYWFVKFQLASAFRMSEVLSTTKGKIEKDIIRVTRKGNVPKYIPIINRMKLLLQEMPLPQKSTDRLFPYSTDAVWRFYKRFRTKTGLNIVSHDLRKYTLSEMANAGVPVNFTKDYAGHNDIKTTLKYYVRSDKKKMADVIDEKLTAA